MIGTQEGTPQPHGEGHSGFSMYADCHSGRRSHTRRIIMEHGRSQEYCGVRSTAHRMNTDSTIPIHQAALKASPRLESTITEGHLSQPPYVLHGRPPARDEESMRHSKAFPGIPEDQYAPAMPLYSTLFRSKREPRHFAFISYRWFFGGSMVIDDKKEPCC